MAGKGMFRVTSPDGVSTTAMRAGPRKPDGVVLIHGVLHSRLIWKRQFADPALADLNMVAYDIRGHGDADKPVDPDAYGDPRRYGDELLAVIDAAGIERPIFVGWSLGSRVLFSYLRHHGASRVAGLMIVGARMKTLDNPPVTPASEAMAACASDDLAVRIAARTAFARYCHEIDPGPDELSEIVAASMVMPPQVLRAVAGRPLDVRDIMKGLDLPIRIVQGDRDLINDPVFAEEAAAMNPRARLSVYRDIGHTPFFEAPERFNRELLDFTREAFGR